MGRMFEFITKVWNPIGGDCKNNCPYCWAKRLIKKYDMKKYTGEPKLYRKQLKKKFKETDFVFVQDMSDLFGSWVPREIIQEVLDYIKQSEATFLLLTKNPKRYLEFEIPENCVCGATIETDTGFRGDRFDAMTALNHERKMVSIEPVMYFSRCFLPRLILCGLEFVAVGYDNYGCGLDEPLLDNVNELISNLEKNGIKVYKKTLRERSA